MTAGDSNCTTPLVGWRSSRSTTHPSKTSPTRPWSSMASTRSTQPRSAAPARRPPSAISPRRASRAVSTHSGGSWRVPVDEAAQRGRAVGVGGGDGGVGGDLREFAVAEGRVAGAAQEGRALLEEGRVLRALRVQGADQPVVRDVVRPVDVQGVRGTAQAADRAVGGRGQRAEDPGAVGDHQVRRGHPGEQGDLRVPAFGGERGAVGQLVRPLLSDDLLLRHVERDASALDLQRLPQLPDLLQERERLLGRA